MVSILYHNVFIVSTLYLCSPRQEAGRDWQEEGGGPRQAGGSGRWQEGQEGLHDAGEKEETEGESAWEVVVVVMSLL